MVAFTIATSGPLPDRWVGAEQGPASLATSSAHAPYPVMRETPAPSAQAAFVGVATSPSDGVFGRDRRGGRDLTGGHSNRVAQTSQA